MDFFLYFSLYTVTGFSAFLYLFASFQRNTAPAYTSGRCCRMQETLPLSAFVRHMQAAHKSHIPNRRKAPMPPEASHPFGNRLPLLLVLSLRKTFSLFGTIRTFGADIIGTVCQHNPLRITAHFSDTRLHIAAECIAVAIALKQRHTQQMVSPKLSLHKSVHWRHAAIFSGSHPPRKPERQKSHL